MTRRLNVYRRKQRSEKILGWSVLLLICVSSLVVLWGGSICAPGSVHDQLLVVGIGGVFASFVCAIAFLADPS